MPETGQLGRYERVARIGSGGFAEVYKARLRGFAGFERVVAIKRVLPRVAEEREVVDMFIEEAKLAGRLRHPNIAQIFDLGRLDESYYIAMEWVDGKDLRSIWNRCRERAHALPVAAVTYVFEQVCDALQYAHYAEGPDGRPLSIIHRDVSPQNILVSFAGDVKVIDFGLAKARGRAIQTQVGILKGKVSYASPEQAWGKPLDRRSDVYAVGICMWEMLTGRRLFERGDDVDTILAVRAGEIVPPREVDPTIPPRLEAIVLRALERDLDRRYRSALAMQEDLIDFGQRLEARFDKRQLQLWMEDMWPELAPQEPDMDPTKPVDIRHAEELRAASAGSLELPSFEDGTLPEWDDHTTDRRHVIDTGSLANIVTTQERIVSIDDTQVDRLPSDTTVTPPSDDGDGET